MPYRAPTIRLRVSEGRVGRYTIVRLLGRGAMGAVYLARDPMFDRLVALKTVVLPEGSDLDEGDSSRARFREEARLSGRLSHPHIVSVFDCGEEGRTLWLSMEYVSGGSLASRMTPGAVPLCVAERIRVLAEVAGALSHAHARGVIHRDVKPANILLTPSGVAKVSDFGIGKLLAGGVDLTATGEMVGSPAYMSPEQMRGERADARSDLFSFGIVLYQVLAGRKPFPAENLTALVRQIQHEEPDDPRTLNPEVPDAAVAILSRLLAKPPEHRYPSAAAAEADLRALHASLTGGDGGLSATIAAAPFPEAAVPAPPPAEASPPAAAPFAATAAVAVPALLSPAETVPAAALRPRSRARDLLLATGAAGTLLVIGLLLSGTGRREEPSSGPAGAGAAAPAATVPVPSPAPTAVPPSLEEEPASTPVALLPAPYLDIRPSSVEVQRAEVGRAVRFAIDPPQARVFLNGRLVGIAADWSGLEGAPDLELPAGETHTLRLAHAGRRDLVVYLTLRREAPPVARLEAALPPGKPWGSTGPRGILAPPAHDTRGAVRLDVAQKTRVSVDGRLVGTAAGLRDGLLHLGDLGVHSLTLSAGKSRRSMRIRVWPGAPPAAPVIRDGMP